MSGGLFIQASRSGPANRPRELGRAVGLELLAKGAAEIIERSRPSEGRRRPFRKYGFLQMKPSSSAKRMIQYSVAF